MKKKKANSKTYQLYRNNPGKAGIEKLNKVIDAEDDAVAIAAFLEYETSQLKRDWMELWEDNRKVNTTRRGKLSPSKLKRV